MMKKFLLFTVSLLCATPAFGSDQLCAKEMAGKKACVAGELMLCNKEFNSTTHDFWYEWHAVNDTGQPFDIYLNKKYKQVPGYKPAKCVEAVEPPK